MNPTFHPNRSRRLIAAAVAAALALTALTGCVPKAPPIDPDTTTWFPLPTLPTGASTWYPPGWTSTPPTPTGLPTSTDDPLYQEAVQVYQVFHEEFANVRRAGGAKTLPPSLTNILTGQALVAISTLAARQVADGTHFVGAAQLDLVSTRPYTLDPSDGALVGIEACEENTAVIVDATGQETSTSGHTWWSYQTFYQRNADLHLVMSDIQGRMVDSCPA